MKPKSGSRPNNKTSGVIKEYKSHLIECKQYKNAILNTLNDIGHKRTISSFCIKLYDTIKDHKNDTKYMVNFLKQASTSKLKNVFEKQGDEFNQNFLFVNFLAEQESRIMVTEFQKTIISIVGDDSLYPEWY